MTASNAFKPLDELFRFPPTLLPRNITFDNFRDLSEVNGKLMGPIFSRYFFNTIFITLVGTVGHVIIASMAAYPLAKYKFPGKTIFFTGCIFIDVFTTRDSNT